MDTASSYNVENMTHSRGIGAWPQAAVTFDPPPPNTRELGQEHRAGWWIKTHKHNRETPHLLQEACQKRTALSQLAMPVFRRFGRSLLTIGYCAGAITGPHVDRHSHLQASLVTGAYMSKCQRKGNLMPCWRARETHYASKVEERSFHSSCSSSAFFLNCVFPDRMRHFSTRVKACAG